MRTIKFKGKSIKTGEWLYGSHLYILDRDFIYIDVSNGIFLENEVDTKTVGQFTGLHDKNGREIYEGDILKGAWDTIFQVFYDDCYLGFRAKEKGGRENCIDYYGLDRIEIIGNIHDNHELLKQQEL